MVSLSRTRSARAFSAAEARRYVHHARGTSLAMAGEAIARIGVPFEIERQLHDADPGGPASSTRASSWPPVRRT